MRYCIRLIVLLSLLVFLPLNAQAEGKVLVIHIEGAIGPVTQDLIVRSIARAEAESADLLVLEMNTPGGLDTSMRTIISAILAPRCRLPLTLPPPAHALPVREPTSLCQPPCDNGSRH